MAREIRMVPKDWVHPVRDTIPPINMSDARQVLCNLMPLRDKQLEILWSGHDRTHIMMYSTSDCEGLIPVSPPMPDKESLAKWLVDNNASAFGSFTATYDQWMATIEAGYAPSMVLLGDGTWMTGVAASEAD